MDTETCWKLYEFEWEQRNALTSAVGIPIVAVTAIGGAIATMALSFPYHVAPLLTFVFGVSLAVAAGLLIASIVLIFRFLLTASYRKLASPVLMLIHSQELIEWHLANNSSRAAAITEFKHEFMLHMAKATHVNFSNNEQRSECVRNATISLAAALVVLGAAVGCYVLAQQFTTDPVHNVRIVQ